MHLTAEEGRVESPGCRTPDFGDMWRYGCRKSPSVLSGVSRENSVCNGALHVIALCGPGDKVSLFLEDWELARVALSCHIALDMLW